MTHLDHSTRPNQPNNTVPNPSQTVSMIPKTLLLIKQIRPRTPQIDNLRTPIPILLQPRTLKAIERIADPLATTHNALILVIAKGALVANAYESGGTHIGVADGAFAVAFVAESADGDAGLFAAHDEVGVVTGHFCFLLWTVGGLEGFKKICEYVVVVER